MSVSRAAGYPDLSNAGLSRIIPIMFAAKARERFYEATCLSEIANTDFTGEIKDMGDKVVIPSIPDVPIRDYKKGQLLDLDFLESPAIELNISSAKSFNFGVDDIDLKQVKIKDWINKYAENASTRTKITIETEVFGAVYADIDTNNTGTAAGKISANINLGASGSAVAITKVNVIDYIVSAGQILDEQNIPEDGRWFVIPAWMASLIKKSDLKDASLTGDSQTPLRNGRLGMIDRFTVYNSNLLAKDNSTDYHILFGHKSALSFVTNFVKVELYRPERSFAEAMKGLNVYGYKTVQPIGMGQIVGKQG